MSHRKVHSHGSIPFSWEDKPGVCKTPLGINQLKSLSPSTLQVPPATPSLQDMLKIPLPPCPSHSQPPHRSTSGKGFRWQEDPFLVAYKEISRSDQKKCKLPTDNNKKKGVGSGSTVRKSKSFFWCKSSNDARDGNFVQLPRLPRDRSRTLTLGEELKRDFKYEAWV